MVSSADKFFQNKNCHNIIFVVDVSKTIRICLLVQKGPYGVLINAIIIGLYVFVCSTQYGILYQRICLSSFVELPIFISFALVSYRWETKSIIKAF